MSVRRRDFLAGASALAIAGFLPIRFSFAQPAGEELPRLPVLHAGERGAFRLDAVMGETAFAGGAPTPTLGFSQPYLGPIVRLNTGTTVQAEVHNGTNRDISVHWHGLLVSGDVDGSPHNLIRPGEVWQPELDITQGPATLWYHTHVHGHTAEDVYTGLAGVLIVDDGRDDDRGLPTTEGVDDIVLVLQDKRVGPEGSARYERTLADALHGFLGNTILVNGVTGPVASVPAGIVRLRLVNASNARNDDLAFDDGRPIHLAATDQGYLPAPVEIGRLRLTPGERAELLVDFASAGDGLLVSLPHDEGHGAGMMMHDMGGPQQEDPFTTAFEVVSFRVSDGLPVAVTELPSKLAEELPEAGEPAASRRITLNDMGMMTGGMGGMNMGGMGGMNMNDADGPLLDGQPVAFGINGNVFDMSRIDLEVGLGTTERWTIGGEMMGHPFHIHGARFRVVREHDGPVRPENSGWKDTVFADGEVELLVEFAHRASADFPFMYHCHVLEHEDLGMMGQLTVG